MRSSDLLNILDFEVILITVNICMALNHLQSNLAYFILFTTYQEGLILGLSVWLKW
jgi:hypothetical protein